MQFLTKRALALSTLALVLTLWRAWFDPLSGFWDEYIRTEAGLLAMTLGYTAAYGGWAYALHVASRGSRRGFVAAFALNAFMWFAEPVLTSTFYCPGICPGTSLTFNVANLASLLFGLIAIIAMFLHLRSSQAAA